MLVNAQTELEGMFRVVQGILHVPSHANRVPGVYTASNLFLLAYNCAPLRLQYFRSIVAVYPAYRLWGLCSVLTVYTVQSMQSMSRVHCIYTSCTLQLYSTSVWVDNGKN